MQFVGPRNRPKSEIVSQRRYGLGAPGSHREAEEGIIPWNEIASGFFWTVGAGAGAGIIATGAAVFKARKATA